MGELLILPLNLGLPSTKLRVQHADERVDLLDLAHVYRQTRHVRGAGSRIRHSLTIARVVSDTGPKKYLKAIGHGNSPIRAPANEAFPEAPRDRGAADFQFLSRLGYGGIEPVHDSVSDLVI